MKSLEELINEISVFAEKATQLIIADLQKQRFENQGAFNDHERWSDNRPDVSYEKYYKPPLVDSGNLLAELTNPTNWDLKPLRQGNKLILDVPQRETFTDSKYDKLDMGGTGGTWLGSRTGKKMTVKNVPARPFKELSEQDMLYIEQQLELAIKQKYGNV